MGEAAAAADVRILSKCLIRPSPRPNHGEDGAPKLIHLTPWDLRLLSVDYIQKGLLFRKPNHPTDHIVAGLQSSFARTLDHFFPLAGRLHTVKHESDPPSLSISLECNDEGAEFIHASVPDVTVSDIADALYIPSVVLSLFPLNGVLSYDGHFLPVLAVQVSELADGIFIGLSANHSVIDGTSFWHFFNSWSEICRTGGEDSNLKLPVVDRWFIESCTPPIKLPFGGEAEFIRRRKSNEITEGAFNFPAESVAKLKAKANKEMGTERISSLQSVLAHLWRSVTRLRDLDPEQETTYAFLMGCRTRVTPPLPEEYLGNSVFVIKAKAKVGEVLEKGLGWTAWVLNQAIATQKESAVREMLEQWPEKPTFTYVEGVNPWDLITGSSPRFNVYGNDFGWGKPVTVRSGCGNKGDGKATIYPGPEKGSMALEVSLSAQVLSKLVEDKEFMEMVGKQ